MTTVIPSLHPTKAQLHTHVTKTKPTEKMVKVSRSIFVDLAKGLYHSKIFKAIVLTGLVVGGLLFFASPPGWVVAATAVGALVSGILIQMPGKGFQKLQSEAKAIHRLFEKSNYDVVYTHSNGSKIVLGALPNRLQSEGERLVKKEGIGAVLSINEGWERKPIGLSLPYKVEDWLSLGVDYAGIYVKDHTLLSENELEEAADLIHGWLEAGKNVYIHCLAGKGRSAIALAAYLIKYPFRNDKCPSKTAEDTILKNRPVSTIKKKREQLARFSLKHLPIS